MARPWRNAALLACGLVACAREPAPVRPRLVVLFATCSLNKDFLAPYGGDAALTPELAALAAQSVVFERHMTESPVSGIAYASLFTGAQADQHGVYHHPSRLSERMLTIFEAFGAAGYETHYWNGHAMAGADLDYAQGVAPEHVYPSADYTGNDKSFARLLLQKDDPWFQDLARRLQQDPELRVLIVANFSVTHAAYTRQLKPAAVRAFLERHPALAQGTSPEALMADLERLTPIYEENRLGFEWDYPNTAASLGLSAEDRQALARVLELQYRADVGLLDTLLGGCLANLRANGLEEDTLFAFTADHGEYLFDPEHLFQWSHGLQLVPEELSVPWILRAPRKLFAPGRYPEVTRSIDVFPTLAGLCGVPLPERAPVQGTNLAAALLGHEQPPRQLAPSHTKVLDERLMKEFEPFALVRGYYPSTDPEWMWVAVREGDRFARWRNRGDGTFVHELFDLAVDPLARKDLYDAGDPEHARLAHWLESYKARLIEAYSSERGVDAEKIEADLRALGYVK